MLKLALILFSLAAHAADPAIVSVPHAYENIGKQVSVLKDQHNSYTFDQVTSTAAAGKFVRSTESILNLGNSASAFWIKIRYQNPGTQTAYLIVDVPNIDHIDFYAADGRGVVVRRHTGSLSAPNPDVVATNQYLFDLLPTGVQGKDVYLKIRSSNIMLVALKIADAKTLISSSNYKLGFEAIYSGILIMLFIFNVFLFISVKDRTYLYYSVYIAALLIYVVLYLRGYSYILGPDIRRFVNLYPHVFASLATIAAFFFSWEFLGIKERVPKMVPVYKVMVGLWIILLIIAMFGGKSVLAVLVNYLTFISCMVAWYAGLCAYRNGLKPALYYLIAWFAVALSFVIALLGLTHVIPYYDLSYEVGPIGTTIEMLFLSFALGDRFNHIRQEKNRIKKENLKLILSHNEKLEFVVEERTRKLSKANAEKDKLFSIIAHDLRSPFNSLVSILELNDNDMLNLEELKMLLQETRKNVDQIHLTLNNLLYWAKGQMEMPGSNPEDFDLEAMAERLILVYQPLSMSKNVQLITSTSGSCNVFADVNEINLVLRNLIDNAIKFSPQNSVIRIVMEQQDSKVQISVCNAAQESRAAKLETLLDPMEFSSTPGTNNEQGIGLGLLLCREYIQLNGGDMQVVARDHQVIISFSLPAA
ncbi:sensor histidine kinase [Pedobacter ginsengisoli]|uniref:sensor histidine kinase n=1 Tax=Pedobacter ginsengisoli TaxID=363852 RepID=UPI0025507621|nr:sensor histidine kinase [Pedobacter ginsengisoli]